jgi:RimJ/RimL family protein N-acetyltransferase
MISIPTIETERLVLRGFRNDDLDAYAEMMADPEVQRFLGGVQARVDAWRGMTSVLGHWALRGFGLWAVERKSDRALIGRVGVQYPEGWPSTEIAWTLGRPYWGQGYATEAAKASLDFGFKATAVPKLISLIDPENHPSQRVALRLGYSKGPKGTITIFGKSYELDVWEMPRDRWSKA